MFQEARWPVLLQQFTNFLQGFLPLSLSPKNSSFHVGAHPFTWQLLCDKIMSYLQKINIFGVREGVMKIYLERGWRVNGLHFHWIILKFSKSE